MTGALYLTETVFTVLKSDSPGGMLNIELNVLDPWGFNVQCEQIVIHLKFIYNGRFGTRRKFGYTGDLAKWGWGSKMLFSGGSSVCRSSSCLRIFKCCRRTVVPSFTYSCGSS